MLLSPARGAGRATRSSSATAGRRPDVPGRPRRALRRGVGRLPVHARQPEGRVPRALVPHGGLPPLVQRRPEHGDLRVPRRLPRRRGAAGVRRLEAGGPGWTGRTDAVPVRRRASYEGFEGDTLASALLANGIVVVVSGGRSSAGLAADARRRRGAERLRRGAGALRRPDRGRHGRRAGRGPGGARRARASALSPVRSAAPPWASGTRTGVETS